MKRFMAIVALLLLATGLGAVPALAAAPTVTQTSVTVLTTTGRTALTYTGYMNGESFQQDGITTVAGWQYSAFWDQSGHVNLSRRQLPGGAWQNLRLTDYTTTSTDYPARSTATGGSRARSPTFTPYTPPEPPSPPEV